MSYLPELRTSLVRAAERQTREPVTTRRSQGWFGVAAATAVAVAVVAVAIVLVGHRHGSGPGLRAGHGALPAGWPKVPPPPPDPNPSVAQSNLIAQAGHATRAHDPACAATRQLPTFSPGSPGPGLTSLLGVLRRPRTPADSLPNELFQHGPGGVEAPAIRLARTDDGTSLYIVPLAGLGFRPVPARCAGEERAALVRAMKGSPGEAVRATLKAQAQYLAWQQYEGQHPEGICLAEAEHAPGGGASLAGSGLACGWGVAQIEQGWAGLGTEGSPHLDVFHGIAPDGVASVTLELPHGGSVGARVVNNVYIARLPAYGEHVAQIVWRAADGSVIRTTRVP